MKEQILKNIIYQVENNEKYGIAVKNNNANSWLYNMHTMADLKQKGFSTVNSFLNKIYDAGFPDVTIYLKKSNGSSSVYVKDQSIRLKSEGTRAESKQLTLLDSPQTNTNQTIPMANNQQQQQANNNINGLFGSVDPRVLDLYAHSKNYNELLPKYVDLETRYTELKDRYNELDRKYELQSRDLKDSEKEVAKLSNKAPYLSDGMASTLVDQGLPMLFKTIGNLASGGGGLAGTVQPEIEQVNYSETKQRLLNLVKNEQFTDEYCALFTDLINKIIEDPKKVELLKNI